MRYILTVSQSYIIFALTSLEERNNTLLKAKYNCLSNITCRKANIANGVAINPYRYAAKSAGKRFLRHFFTHPGKDFLPKNEPRRSDKISLRRLNTFLRRVGL